MSLESALAWLSQQQVGMEHLLGELVEISSHTPDRAGVTAVAERYVAATRALTHDALVGGVVPSESGRFGAHVALATRCDAAATVLVGHHDTVFPKDKFAGFRQDGALLRGPGVLDMKGGLVVIAYALGALENAGALGRAAVRLVSVADEEIGSPEGRKLVEDAARAAASALVFESGRKNDQIITRRKGVGGLSVIAHGKASHAGNNHAEGVNAIWALARFIDRAQSLTDAGRGVTVNVGKVTGGIGKNTVPDRAEAEVDLRFVDAADGAAVVAALRAAAEGAAAEVAGARVEIRGGISRQPLARTDGSAALASEYAACARASGLGGDEAPLLGGGSDANTVAALGVPAIDGLGPRGLGFHTVDEFIERDTLIPKAAALTRFLFTRLSAANRGSQL